MLKVHIGSTLNLNTTNLAMFYWWPWALPADSSPNLCGRWTSKTSIELKSGSLPLSQTVETTSQWKPVCLLCLWTLKSKNLWLEDRKGKLKIKKNMMQTTKQFQLFFRCLAVHVWIHDVGQQTFHISLWWFFHSESSCWTGANVIQTFLGRFLWMLIFKEDFYLHSS